MLRALVLATWVSAGLCSGAAAQRVLPPPPPGPRGDLAPQPQATKKEPSPLAIESTPMALPQPDPLRAGHDLEVGRFYYNRGDYVGALARFSDAIVYDPAFAEAYCRAADTQWKMRRYAPARAQWQRCLTVAGSGRWADYALAALRRHKGSE